MIKKFLRKFVTLINPLRISSAIREYLNWWRVWGSPPIRVWLAAAKHFRAHEFRLAERAYARGLVRRPLHPAADCARLDRAYCLFQLGDLFAAIEILSGIVGRQMMLPEAYVLLGRLRIYVGDPRAASSTLSEALRLFPDDVQVNVWAAYAAFNTKLRSQTVEAAKSRLTRIRSRLPLNSKHRVSVETALALYEMQFGSVKESERMLARVLANGNPPYEAVLLRGRSFWQQDRLHQARDQFQRAMKLSPKDPRPALYLARLYSEHPDLFEAEWAEQVAKLSCQLSCYQNPDCLRVLSGIYHQLGKLDEAAIFELHARSMESAREVDFDEIKRVEEQLLELQRVY